MLSPASLLAVGLKFAWKIPSIGAEHWWLLPQTPQQQAMNILRKGESCESFFILKSISSITLRWVPDLKCYNDSLTIKHVRRGWASAWIRIAQYLQYFIRIQDSKQVSQSWSIKHLSSCLQYIFWWWNCRAANMKTMNELSKILHEYLNSW